MPASLSVAVTPHWFNGWFLRLLAVPVVRVDGADQTVAWGRAATVNVVSGLHTVAAGARYRGTRSVLGLEPADVRVADGEHLRLAARNGPLNHQPFTVRPER